MDSEGFQAVPHILTNKEQQITVVMEGRRPLCWSCKQLGYLVGYCPQKTSTNNNNKTTSIKLPWNLGTIQTIWKKDGPRLPEERKHKNKKPTKQKKQKKQQQQPNH